MNWRNAVIGALVGLAMFRRPVGLLVGAVIGYLLGPRWGNESVKVRPARMLEPLFGLAGALAKADGRVSDAEVSAAEHWMTRLDLNRGMRKQAIAAFDAGKQPAFAVDTHARELAAYCLVRLDLKLMMLGALQQIASADGRLHVEADRLMQRIVTTMEVPDDLWAQARARFDRGDGVADPVPGVAPATAADYRVLGVHANAGDAEVRRAYRRLLTKHHPDKLSGSNASAAERANAEERTRQLIAAYERIKNGRGIR